MKNLLYISLVLFHALSAGETENHIFDLLPAKEEFSYKKIEGGFSGAVVLNVETSSGKNYVYKKLSKDDLPCVVREIAVIKKIGEIGIGPKLTCSDFSRGEILTEYIPNKSWPKFCSNTKPYMAAMKRLKKAHDSIPLRLGGNHLKPFSFIDTISEKLDNASWLPIQYYKMLEEIRTLYLTMDAQFEDHPVVCHGDFTTSNVLLGRKGPELIDWSTSGFGHPFFDVAKFTLRFEREDRLLMLGAYLGHPPTDAEVLDFDRIDLAFLALVVLNRFKDAVKQAGYYTKSELEKILEKEELPSFTTIAFGDTSVKAKQLGGVYALHEFAKRLKSLQK